MDPPMCTLAQLYDGTYTIDDVADMHELIDLRIYLSEQQES